MKIYFKYILLLILLSTFLVACKKYVAGPKGETGQAGKNGNANQTSISTLAILSQQWVTNNVKKDWNTDIFSDLITTDVILKSQVDVYVSINSEWHELPYSNGDRHLQYVLVLGKIHLNYFKTHGVDNQPDAMNFRVLIISIK